MSYEDITDRSNPFNTTGLSLEDRALLHYVQAARAFTGADIVCTSTTDHPEFSNSGNRSRHVQLGTDGKGLAVDLRLRTRGTARDHHRPVFDSFVPVERQLHELIYAYPPTGKRADGTTGPYNIRAGRRVAPYAVSDHKDHVHVSVNRGVLVEWPHRAPATPQEAHMKFPGTRVQKVPGRPAVNGRWPMWGFKPNGDVFCWNFTPDMPQRVPTAEEKRVVTGNGQFEVIGLIPRDDGVFGYFLVNDDADDRGGLATFTFS